MPASAPTSNPITTPVTGRYWVDPGHTTVTVTARHMFGLGRVTGRITLRTAELTVADPISASRVQARIDAATFESGNPARDRAVRSAKYLDTDAHPEISFHADVVRDDGSVMGTVIAHGAAAATDLTVEEIEQFGTVLMIRAKCRIDRYAHGVTAGKGIAGRRITVRIDATCHRIDDD